VIAARPSLLNFMIADSTPDGDRPGIIPDGASRRTARPGAWRGRRAAGRLTRPADPGAAGDTRAALPVPALPKGNPDMLVLDGGNAMRYLVSELEREH
jgi:hypothetical protein